jgi:tetratricopeptide (TPR) repeat protein
MTKGQVKRAALFLGAIGFWGSPALADEVDDYTRKLVDLDQRARQLSIELPQAQTPSPDIADRRVLDAQAFYMQKDYEQAATVLMDVVDKYPGTRAYDDALFLLGESLFQAHDFHTARGYLEQAVAKNTGSKPEQLALQRLVEISLRTGDYEKIDGYLQRLQTLPIAQMEPAIPYVRGKYYFFRGRLDDAINVFAAVPQNNPYFFQARYFIATILIKKGDLAGATQNFDALLKVQAPDASGKDIQDLARLAIARILYERSQFDKAIEAYLAIPRQSKYWAEALREQAWTYIKAKDWQRAYRSINLLLLAEPDAPDGPSLRLIEGNLHLRMNNFYLASDTFSKVRDEFEPVHRQLQQVLVRSQTDPAYFDSLVGKSLDKFDIGAFVPATAVRWVKAEPDVARMVALASNVGDIQRDLGDSQKLLDRIEHAMQGSGKVAMFPDLASRRTKSTEMMNEVVTTRQKMVGKMRAILDPILSPEERKALDVIAIERDGVERQVTALPTTDEGIASHEKKMRDQFAQIDSQASELNVSIQNLEAELVAIEQYYRVSRSEQKIRPEDIQGPVRDMRGVIEGLRATHDKLREAIADARRDSAAAGGIGEAERETSKKLTELLRRESEIQKQALVRLSGNDRANVERMQGVLYRCDAIESMLVAFDQRIDGQVATRLETVVRYLKTEKEALAKAMERLNGIMDESKSMGGGLAQAMFTRVADKFYDLVVQSDVGIIDVAWGLKDQKTNTVTRLTNQKSMEIKALDEDFRRVMEEDK